MTPPTQFERWNPPVKTTPTGIMYTCVIHGSPLSAIIAGDVTTWYCPICRGEQMLREAQAGGKT